MIGAANESPPLTAAAFFAERSFTAERLRFRFALSCFFMLPSWVDDGSLLALGVRVGYRDRARALPRDPWPGARRRSSPTGPSPWSAPRRNASSPLPLAVPASRQQKPTLDRAGLRRRQVPQLRPPPASHRLALVRHLSHDRFS